MNWEADIYHAKQLVGHFLRTPAGSELHFLPESIANPPFPGYLAVKIQYSSNPLVAEGVNLHPYFANLLPEGTRARIIMQSRRIAKDDLLGLLIAAGQNLIGDAYILPHGQDLTEKHAPENLTEVSFWEEFNSNLQNSPDADIPGVQEKISHASIFLPTKTAQQKEGILKLNPPDFPRLVENEAFFLDAAKDVGLTVNEWDVVHDRENESGLLLQRFDRVNTPTGIISLHQEDMCQLRGEYPANKYTIPMRSVFETLEEVATSPAQAKLEVLTRYAFAYLMGNADLHAKNISLLWTNGVIQPSPNYDLISTLAYRDLKPNMALPLDGKDTNFKRKDFLTFAHRHGLPEKSVNRRLDLLLKRFEPWIARFPEIGYDKTVTEHMQTICQRRIQDLRP